MSNALPGEQSSTTVSIVGSTGSIGTQAIDVIEANPERFRVHAIGARRSVDVLVEQAARVNPAIVAIADLALESELKSRLPSHIEVRAGEGALVSIVDDVDVVLNSVVGFAGLPITLKALTNGSRLALANKESLVAAGPLVQRVRHTPGAEIVPVDSEHAAIHQCLRSETENGYGEGRALSKLVVTASGGPFRGRTREQLQDVSVDEAMAHPTWNMGPKITIDSSTLFNKGLEVIEAHELFGVPYDQIDVVVHPQSILHSAVEFTDGSTIAQLSHPDMRLPIGYALGYPERLDVAYGALNWTSLPPLVFEAPDREVFRCLNLAFEAGKMGGTAPTWLNAANEVAVAAFLEGRASWLDISAILETVLGTYNAEQPETIEHVVEADAEARRRANQAIQDLGRKEI